MGLREEERWNSGMGEHGTEGRIEVRPERKAGRPGLRLDFDKVRGLV